MKPGLWEILILAFVIVLLFGSTRLPAAGRYLGRGLREFKDGLLGKDDQQERLPTEN
jgi:sec-independent protein translocase protein TatA